MSAEQFLARVARTGLLDEALVAKLNKQIASSGGKVTAEAVAKTLIKNGHLTKAQAAKFLSEAAANPNPTPSEESLPTIVDAAPVADDDLALVLDDDEQKEEDELALVPDEDELQEDEVVMLEDASRDGSGTPPTILDQEPEPIGGLQPIDGLQPVAAAGGLETLDDGGGLQTVTEAGLEPIDGGLQPLDEQSLGGEPMQPAGPPPKAGKFTKKTRTGSVWDSTLLYVGGGALALLLIAGVWLWYSLTRGTAAEMFQAAEEDYRSQAYAQAIAKYERFLQTYPDDPNVSLARVKIGTGQLWQSVEGSQNKEPALKAAKEILPKIQEEEAFSEVRAELASILPEIAEGFAGQARLKEDVTQAQQLLDLANDAMDLVNTPAYIPTSLRKSIETRLDAIREDMLLAERNINQTKRLTTDVAQIRQAAQAGQTVEAFAIRRKLLQDYPGLETHPSLVEAVRLITDKERALVQVVEEPLQAVTTDHAKPTSFEVALVSRHGPGTGGDTKQMVYFLARGTIYALQADTGGMAWRRAVGYETTMPPLPLARQAGADVIVVDQQRHELLRLKGDTGELVWRLPIGEPFAEPVIEGKRMFVAAASGKIYDVDPETGVAARHVQIPQTLRVGPGLGPGPYMYQVGDHSNLYILDKNTLECKEVHYLGHKPGTIDTPPVMILGHLFVAENAGVDYCNLRFLATDVEGESVKPVGKPLRLDGQVLVAPLVSGARLIVLTDLGAMRVLEVNTAAPENPVADAVEPLVASFRTPLLSYAVYDGGRLWVGNDRFTLREIQMSLNQIATKWIKNQRDTFVAPPQLIGRTVYHLRRRQGSPAYTATAVDGDEGNVLWETDLACPTALLNVDMQRQQVHSISAQAELFELTPEVFSQGHLDEPGSAAVGAARSVPFDEPIPLDNDRWALASEVERHRVIVYDPQAVSASSRLLARPLKDIAGAQVTATPVFFQGGLLVPLDNGQVALIDPASGERKALPFQPRVEAGSKVQWQRPAVVGQDFVIVDNRRKLYRVGLKSQPEPNLQESAQAEMEIDIASQLAAAGDTVYGVVRGANADTVVSFAAADLAVGKEWALEGRVTWGPETMGDQVLVATDTDGLLCFQAGQQQQWKSPLAYGTLVGRPLVQDGDLILTSLPGTVWRISGTDGQELQKTDVGQPLGSSPVAFGSRLALSAADGTLLVIPALNGAAAGQ
jgi:outer membrane protein assembly factor BamB/TolA-binding protein